MEAIILAGGFGTRLSHIVKDLPKPMASVAGKPFLVYIINDLIDKGITKFVLAVGYKKECIMEYFKENYRGCTISYSSEDTPLFTGGAIKQALEYCTEDNIFIINGDTFFNVNLEGMLKSHIENQADLTIATKTMKNIKRYGTVKLDNNRIIDFLEKQPLQEGRINGGIYIIKKSLLEAVEEKKFSFEIDFMQKYIQMLNIFSYPSEGYFIDIGIEEDYYIAQKEFKRLGELCE